MDSIRFKVVADTSWKFSMTDIGITPSWMIYSHFTLVVLYGLRGFILKEWGFVPSIYFEAIKWSLFILSGAMIAITLLPAIRRNKRIYFKVTSERKWQLNLIGK